MRLQRNLDLELRLLALDATVVATSNPAGPSAAGLTMNVAAGTYFIRVDGIGVGDPASTGYSDYASLGWYRLTLTSPGSPTTTTTTTTTTTPTTSTTSTTTPATTTTTISTTTTTTPATTTTTTPAITTTTITPTTTTTTTTPPTTTTTTAPSRTVRVADVTVSAGTTPGSARAQVTLVDSNGQPVAAAVVTGSWSGRAKGTSSATTDSAGIARIPDSVLVRKNGQVGFTVTSVSVAPGTGAAWDGISVSGSAKL